MIPCVIFARAASVTFVISGTSEGERGFMRTATKCLTVLGVLLLPVPLFAQASLTGTVRDVSGAVLPGVTVEASSPALIEKTRSATTDGRASTASSICGPAPTS